MRTVLFIFCAVCLLLPACVNYGVKDKDPASFTLESYKAKEDFQTFRTILERAHPSLYSYQSKKRMDLIFDSIGKTISKKITYRDFYNKLCFISNEIGCSHTAISLPSSIYDSLYNRELFFPLPVLLVEGKLLVNSDLDLPHGTEILKINNKPAAAILDSLMFYNAVEGHHRETQRYMASTEFGLQYFLKFGGQKNFFITIKDTSGTTQMITRPGINLTDIEANQDNRYYFDASDVDYSFVIDNELKRAVLRLYTFSFGTTNKQNVFEAFLKNSFELLKKKPDINTLVIDLRENAGGLLYNCFLLNSYIAHAPFKEYKNVYSRIKSIPFGEHLSANFSSEDVEKVNGQLKNGFERVANKGYRLSDIAIKSWEPNQYNFTKDVYIITNWRVNSAASYFAFLARKTAGAKTIGFETAGGTHSGNGFASIKYELPGTGFEFQFPYAKMFYTNGDSFSGNGLVPDYTAKDTYESFMKNQDRQLIYLEDSIRINR
jgi:hypothetical protein